MSAANDAMSSLLDEIQEQIIRLDVNIASLECNLCCLNILQAANTARLYENLIPAIRPHGNTLSLQVDS